MSTVLPTVTPTVRPTVRMTDNPLGNLAWSAAGLSPTTMEFMPQLCGIGDPTFTSSALYLMDWEGVWRENAANTAPVYGSRRVENLLRYSEDFSQSEWVKHGTASVDGAVVSLPAQGDGIYQANIAASVSGTVICSATLSGSGTIKLFIRNGFSGIVDQVIEVTLSSAPTRYSFTAPCNGTGLEGVWIRRDVTTATEVTVHNIQFEESTGRTDTEIPSEYIATDVPVGEELFDPDSTSISVGAGTHAFIDGPNEFRTQRDGTTSGTVILVPASSYEAGTYEITGVGWYDAMQSGNWADVRPGIFGFNLSEDGQALSTQVYLDGTQNITMTAPASGYSWRLTDFSMRLVATGPRTKHYGCTNPNHVSGNVVYNAVPELWSDDPDLVTSPWVDNGDGTYTIDGSQGGEVAFREDDILDSGKTYEVTYTLSGSGGGGNFYPYVNGDFGTQTSTDGVHTETLVPTSDSPMTFSAKVGASGTISNISVREVNADGSEIVLGERFADAPSLLAQPAMENSIPQSWDLTDASWTETGTSVAALDAVGMSGAPNTASTLTDDDGAAEEFTNENITIPNDGNPHTLRLWIAKDSDETRFPEVGLDLAGGTLQRLRAQLNTKTGAINERLGAGTYASEANLRGDWWEYLIQVDNNSSGNTTAQAWISPAKSDVIGSVNTAATGSIIVGNVELHEGKTIAEVRGSCPIFTSGSAATTDAVQIAYDIANHSDEQGLLAAEVAILGDNGGSYGFVTAGSSARLLYQNIGDEIVVYDGSSTATENYSNTVGDFVGVASVWDSEAGFKTVYANGLQGSETATTGMSASLGRIDLLRTPTGGGSPAATALIRNVQRYNLPYEAAKAKAEEITS